MTKFDLYTEFLYGHEGETFYTPMCGDVEFDSYDSESTLPIYLKNKDCSLSLQSNGSYRGKSGMCMLFPSKEYYEKYPIDPYTAWSEWKKEEGEVLLPWWIPQLHESYYFIGTDGTYHHTINNNDTNDKVCFACGNCFFFLKEAQEASEQVKQALVNVHRKIRR